MSKTKCPVCHSTWIDPLTSMNKMFCYQCDDFRPFHLKEGQKSVLIDGLVGGRDPDETPAKHLGILYVEKPAGVHIKTLTK